jgi:putative endonuclease
VPASDPRRAIGAAGERVAAAHLEARGLRLLDRNYRTRHGELDIVAADERRIVFCEVKARIGRAATDPFGPLVSIDGRKRRRVRLMAREWLARRSAGGPRPPELRFDAIGVTFDRSGRLVALEHVEGAF